MIIDIHAHIFPDKIAEKAAEHIGAFYDYPMRGDGRVDTLLRFGDEDGVDRFVVHSVAMTPRQARSVNRFIADSVRAHPDRFTGLLSVHPDMDDLEDEIDRSLDSGLSGVKLHPDMQAFALDDPHALPMFEAFARRGLPVLVHAGDSRYRYSTPAQIRFLKQKLPELTLICAHLGGYSQWREARECLFGLGLYADCSSSLFGLTPGEAAEMIRGFGADRVFFGSDFPMWREGEELAKLRKLDLTPDETENILWKNAQRLLHI